MRMYDYAHQWTDKRLLKLERRIAKVYREAHDELSKEAEEYFKKFERRDAAFLMMIDPDFQNLPPAEQREHLEKTGINKNDLWNWMRELNSGKRYTLQEYKEWRTAQMGRGERFMEMRDNMAIRYTNAKQIAFDYVNNDMDRIYSYNFGWSIDDSLAKIKGVGVGDDWTIINEDAIKRLIKNRPDIMPHEIPKWAVNRQEELAWGKKKIREIVTSELLQGTPTKDIAYKMMEKITTMSYNSAIRAARTAVTEAENAGRADCDKRFADMGVEFEKVWRCTNDGKTRPAHQKADGQAKPIDEPFIVWGEELMYPGDASMGASGRNLYNCRCVRERTRPRFKSVLTPEQRKRSNIRVEG